MGRAGGDELSRRRVARGENRLPPAFAVMVAIVVYALLPESLLFVYRLLIPGLEALLLVALLATNPRQMTIRSRWSRWVSMTLSTVVIGTNLVSLGLLIRTLAAESPGGATLLVAGMQVWVTHVIGFALLYWELDRGGPIARRRLTREDLPAADWRFSQDENDDAVQEVRRGSSESSGWVPVFIDYLYLSVTNSSAFSPTDTMPLTSRAKLLMATQASAALLTSLLVVARAVGALGG